MVKTLFTPRREKGIFIVFEGVDGAGKTSARDMLVGKLKERFPDKTITAFRTPNGPIRDILLNRTEKFPDTAELLLYIASHLSTLANYIKPALERDEIVICDRFIDSTRAYQGYGRFLLADTEEFIFDYLINDLPDHTVYVDADEDICVQRITARGNADFMDNEVMDFKSRTAHGMRSIAKIALNSISNENRASCIINNEGLQELSERLDSWIDTYIKEA